MTGSTPFLELLGLWVPDYTMVCVSWQADWFTGWLTDWLGWLTELASNT